MPQKLSEKYPSIASVNGLKNAAVEFGEQLEQNSPIIEILSKSLAQSVDLMGELERVVDENELEQDKPMKPEEAFKKRIAEFQKGIESLRKMIEDNTYSPHPSVKNVYDRVDNSRTDILPNIRITHQNMELPLVANVDPSLIGLTVPELIQAFKDPQLNPLRSTQMSAESSVAKHTAIAETSGRRWQKWQKPMEIDIAWGRVSGNKFIPADTHLRLEVVYDPEEGYVCVPKLVMETKETKQKELNIEAEGKIFNIDSLEGINVAQLNNHIEKELTFA